MVLISDHVTVSFFGKRSELLKGVLALKDVERTVTSHCAE